MQEIHASELTEMLNEGFDGQVRFSGTIYGISDRKEFLTLQGDFYLEQLDRDIHPRSEVRKYCLRINSEENISFTFTPRELATNEYRERHGNIIVVPITISENAVMQIGPRDIIF